MIDLKEIITKYPECKNDSSKLNAILFDLYPKEEKHRKVLVSILESGKLDGLKSDIRFPDFQNLISDFIASGLTRKEAENGLNLWFDALGIKIDESAISDMKISPDHVHEYKTKVVKPTCTEKGYARHWCKCGYEYKDSFVLPIDCEFEEVDRKEPTCESSGYSKLKCKFCGKEKKETIRKKSHSFTPWQITKSASCEHTGSKTKRCTYCGKTETEEIPKTNHTFGDWIEQIHPSCTENGKAVRTCQVCGNAETKPLTATGHNYGAPYTDKEHPHKELRLCSRCGDIDIRDDKETVKKKEEERKTKAKTRKQVIRIFLRSITLITLIALWLLSTLGLMYVIDVIIHDEIFEDTIKFWMWFILIGFLPGSIWLRPLFYMWEIIDKKYK